MALGLVWSDDCDAVLDDDDEEIAPSERRALRPGHPVTWGALTAGTLLDGANYGGTTR